jgi:hypothetical protein
MKRLSLAVLLMRSSTLNSSNWFPTVQCLKLFMWAPNVSRIFLGCSHKYNSRKICTKYRQWKCKFLPAPKYDYLNNYCTRYVDSILIQKPLIARSSAGTIHNDTTGQTAVLWAEREDAVSYTSTLSSATSLCFSSFAHYKSGFVRLPINFLCFLGLLMMFF